MACRQLNNIFKRMEEEEKDETDTLKKQKGFVETLIKYYEHGCRSPQEAYKKIKEIISEDDPEQRNYLREYDAGVFAFQSQQEGQALLHFFEILKNCAEPDQFLVVKSAFATLQLFCDLGQSGPARSLLTDLIQFKAILEKIQDLKMNYNQDTIYIVMDNSGQGSKIKKQPSEEKKGGKKLQVEFYSVLMGSYLKSFAKSPKNPNLVEYEFALSYYETMVN